MVPNDVFVDLPRILRVLQGLYCKCRYYYDHCLSETYHLHDFGICGLLYSRQVPKQKDPNLFACNLLDIAEYGTFLWLLGPEEER